MKIPVDILIESFYLNPDILEKYKTAYKKQYNKEATRDELYNFILVRLPTPITEYSDEEQNELSKRIEFYLFQEFEDEQDHSEDIYDYLDLPPFKIN